MELQVGDRLTDETGDWEVMGRPYTFFVQAEDGIRDVAVTGVQTCALPISRSCGRTPWWWSCRRWRAASRRSRQRGRRGLEMPDQHRFIVGPVITEKSSAAYQARKEYAFRVDTAATKP